MIALQQVALNVISHLLHRFQLGVAVFEKRLDIGSGHNWFLSAGQHASKQDCYRETQGAKGLRLHSTNLGWRKGDVKPTLPERLPLAQGNRSVSSMDGDQFSAAVQIPVHFVFSNPAVGGH